MTSTAFDHLHPRGGDGRFTEKPLNDPGAAVLEQAWQQPPEQPLDDGVQDQPTFATIQQRPTRARYAGSSWQADVHANLLSDWEPGQYADVQPGDIIRLGAIECDTDGNPMWGAHNEYDGQVASITQDRETPRLTFVDGVTVEPFIGCEEPVLRRRPPAEPGQNGLSVDEWRNRLDQLLHAAETGKQTARKISDPWRRDRAIAEARISIRHAKSQLRAFQTSPAVFAAVHNEQLEMWAPNRDTCRHRTRGTVEWFGEKVCGGCGRTNDEIQYAFGPITSPPPDSAETAWHAEAMDAVRRNFYDEFDS